MALSLALGVQAASILSLARTAATGVLATSRAGTVRVTEALAGISAAGLYGIADQSLWALAVVASWQIVAEGCAVAGFGQTLVDIFAPSATDQLVAFVAGAHGLVVLHLAIALSAAYEVTGLNAAIGLRIAGPVSGTVHMIDALHLEAADSGVIGVAKESGRATAQGLVSLGLAVGIGSANGVQTRVGALAMDAGKVVGAIVRLVALAGRGTARLGVAIADSALRADTAVGSRGVFAPGTLVARPFCALINVRASEWGSDESNGALALSGQAQLRGRTVRIRVTSRLAGTVRVADLSGQAVVAGVAHLAAHLLVAALANGAGRGLGAGQVALVADAHVSVGALVAGQAGGRHAHASLFRGGIAFESIGTGALATVLGNAAEGVGSATASGLAGIQALVLNAGLILLALLVAAAADDAVTFDAGQATGALAVIQTGYHADVAHAALAIGAVLRVAAGDAALSVVAQLSAAVHVREALRLAAGTAALG